jgi:hypothetical protein
MSIVQGTFLKTFLIKMKLWTNDEWTTIELQVMSVMFIDTNICESCFYHLQAFNNSNDAFYIIFWLDFIWKDIQTKWLYIKKGTILPNITY